MPEGRGGTGKAVYLDGEFYVFGGETKDDADATAEGVFDRVDVYDPVARSWRIEAAMPRPRHGTFPVLFQSRIYLPGGGEQAGFAQSRTFDVFQRR